MAYVGVSGPSEAEERDEAAAHEISRWAAGQGHVVVCGGLGGVMAAAARGATEAGGVSVGLLPGATRDGAAPQLTVALPTGLGEVRNALLVRCVDVLVCVGGSWGTLSELALAVRTGVPVVALRTWLPAPSDTGQARPPGVPSDTRRVRPPGVPSDTGRVRPGVPFDARGVRPDGSAGPTVVNSAAAACEALGRILHP